jgi:hypothetical protein
LFQYWICQNPGKKKLYKKKYDLTQDEIVFIESMIRPMEEEEKYEN